MASEVAAAAPPEDKEVLRELVGADVAAAAAVVADAAVSGRSAAPATSGLATSAPGDATITLAEAASAEARGAEASDAAVPLAVVPIGAACFAAVKVSKAGAAPATTGVTVALEKTAPVATIAAVPAAALGVSAGATPGPSAGDGIDDVALPTATGATGATGASATDVGGGEMLPVPGNCAPLEPVSAGLAAVLRTGLGPTFLSADAKSLPWAKAVEQLPDAAPD